MRLTLRNNTSNAQTPGQVLLEPPNLDSHTDYHFFNSNARWDFATGKHWHHQIMGAESYNRQFSANPIQSFYRDRHPCRVVPESESGAVATEEFCDFTDPGSRYQYNRASMNAQSSYLLPNFSGTAGYQYEVENAHIPFLAVGHVRRNNQGGFLDFRYAPHPRASLSFGARAEANGNFGTRVVPRVGASLMLLQGRGFWGETRLRAFYGQGIKEPRFDQLLERSIRRPWQPGTEAGIEQDLEHRHRAEVMGQSPLLRGEYFSNRYYNLISFAFCFPLLPPATGNSCGVFIPDAPPSFGYFFNTDRARARGTNLSAEAKIIRWLMVTGSYSYDDSLVLAAPNAFDPTEIPGNRLARRPVNSGTLSAIVGMAASECSALQLFYRARERTAIFWDWA